MYKQDDSRDNRLPSLPDGIAKVSFGITNNGGKKLILDVPCWLMSYTKTGVPRPTIRNKRLQTSDSEMVAKFEHIIESGWFELDAQGNQEVKLVNISYFDNSFQTKDKSWINFSQLVSADIAPVDGQH